MTTPHTSGASLVPPEIQTAYELDPSSIESLAGGIINQTLKAQAFGELAILQKLGPVFDERLIEDFDVVTDYLQQAGWIVPRPVATREGALSVRDNENKLWRAMSHISADGSVPRQELTNDTLHEIGGLLGRFHETLQDLDYQPKYTIPHFHDLEYYLSTLQGAFEALPPAANAIAAEAMEVAPTVFRPVAEESSELLHGDPRLENMLFKEGRPFTLIDFDTIMRGCFWIDVGDMLRSFRSELTKINSSLDEDHLTEGYQSVRFPDTDREEFLQTASLARQRLLFELTARFLNDIAEDYYFDWDRQTYPSRQAHNLARATTQWALFQQG